MTRRFRTLSALILALMLSVTSVSMALARGEFSVHGTMILCLNATQVVVPVGPDGQPQTEQPPCPDCTIGALALAGAAPLPVPVLRERRIAGSPVAVAAVSPRVQGGQGRGPPPRAA